MASRGRILIVDDEANARAALSEILKDEGYATETAADGFKALGKIEDFHPDVILTDVKMPGLDGVSFMEKAKSASPSSVFVIMTAFGSISSAVEAVKKGAENYLTKPLDFEVLTAVVERAMEKASLVQETRQLRDKLRERNAMQHIVAKAPVMQGVLDTIAQIGPAKTSVLILGEKGTGKELIALTIHKASPRTSGPFVRFSCSSVPSHLIESELFGHEPGAVSGAITRREGRLSQAEGGTLFLEDLCDLPLTTQAKLFRFLVDRTFEFLGGGEFQKADVRIIAASQHDLQTEVQRGVLREDLFQKLNVISLKLPPLRERRADILPLASFFLARYADENGKQIDGLTEDAASLLVQYSWPGNVRELENCVERAVVLSESSKISKKHLPIKLLPLSEQDGMPPIPGTTIEHLERYAILKTLEACGGSTSKAAVVLGISTRKIQYKLHEYGTRGKTET